MPPGRRRSSGTPRSGAGTDSGSNGGAPSSTVMTMSSAARSALISTQPAAASIAVEDHVGHGLVDGLDQVVLAVDRGVARLRHRADGRAHLCDPVEVGGDPHSAASVDHQVGAADQACSSTRLPSGSVV